MVESESYTNNPIKIAVVGNVDSGKSTLVGVLTKGEKDDGRGLARQKVFNYNHEQQTGRTTSVTQEIMGFTAENTPYYPQRFNTKKNQYWTEIVKKSAKIVNFLDLCGHEKYLKTTIYGMMSFSPDYGMIIIGSNSGIIGMTREHIMLTQALNIPYYIVFTKIDLCPPNIYKQNLDEIKQHIVDNQRIPHIVSNTLPKEQIQNISKQLKTQPTIVPIFNISSVTKEGVQTLSYFISQLQSLQNINPHTFHANEPVQFDITDNFQITGFGTVVNGLIRSGTVKIGQQLFLGPDVNERFIHVSIRSIHLNRVPAQEVEAGQICTLGIKATNNKDQLVRKNFRKGVIMLDKALNPVAYRFILAEVEVLHHSTTIKQGYQAVFHCGVIRQVVKLDKIISVKNQTEQDFLRNGAKGLVIFKFMYKPEFMRNNQQFILREGQTRVIGLIKQIFQREEEIQFT